MGEWNLFSKAHGACSGKILKIRIYENKAISHICVGEGGGILV